MENLENSNEDKKPIDLLYEQKSLLRKELQSLKKDLGYEGKNMMFLLSNSDASSEIREKGLNQIEEEFNSEPEAIRLNNEISQIQLEIEEINNQQEQEKINTFPSLKQEVLDNIQNLIDTYQSQYEKYDSVRTELINIFNEKIQPGLDLGMSKEAAIGEYVNGTEYFSYPGYIQDIEMINTQLADVILNLEVALENTNNLEVEDMDKLDDTASTWFILRDIKKESFQRQVDFLQQRLDSLKK